MISEQSIRPSVPRYCRGHTFGACKASALGGLLWLRNQRYYSSTVRLPGEFPDLSRALTGRKVEGGLASGQAFLNSIMNRPVFAL